jgi:hypothetical protein
MINVSQVKDKLHIIAGLLFIVTGALCNEWLLAALFSEDGVIAVPHRIIIWMFDLSLIIMGVMLIIFRKFPSKGKMSVIGGTLFIFAGILFIERFIPVIMMGTSLSNDNRILLRIVELYFIFSGLMMILYHKSIDLKNILLFGVISLLCFTLFLSYDFYRAYSSSIAPARKMASDFRDSIHIPDPYLGWKPKPDTVITYKDEENHDAVFYEIDHNGFKKVYNTENHDFSIYFFGDSQTFGLVRNKDTFPNIIKDMYVTDEINVYNAGVMGYGIVQMFQRFLNVKDRLQQGDIIILTPLAEDITRNIKDFFIPYAYLFIDLFPAEKYPFFENGVIKYHKLEISLYNKLKVLSMVAPYTGRFWWALNKKFIPNTTDEAIQMIKIIKKKVEGKGGKFVLFFLPKAKECMQGNYNVDISGFDYFDIMHYFPSENDALDKLIIGNGDKNHWNVEGHEITARAIIETLVKENLIEKKYLKTSIAY